MHLLRHCCFALLITSLARLGMGAPEIKATTAVARYSSGTIENRIVETYAKLAGMPYFQPIETAVRSKDVATRTDARDIAEMAVKDLLFFQYWSELAKSEGATTEALPLDEVDKFHAECLSQGILARIAEETTMSAAQVQRIWKHKQAAVSPDNAREVAYIFRMKSEHTSTTAVRRDLEQLRRRITSNELSFEDAARRYSEAPSASVGGRIGYVTKDMKMNSEFKELVFEAPLNEVSKVQELQNGFYLAKVAPLEGASALTAVDEAQVLNTARQEAVSSATAEAQTKYSNLSLAAAVVKTYPNIPEEVEQRCALIREIQVLQLLAYQHWYKKAKDRWDISEADIEDYYQKNPGEMTDFRRVKVIRYAVDFPTTAPAAPRNLDQSEKVLEQLRAKLPVTTDTQKLMPTVPPGVTVSEPMWIESVDDDKSDAQMHALQPGQATNPVSFKNSMHFFVLLDRRKPPLLPLEEKRDYIVKALVTLREMKARRAEQDRIAKELDLQFLF